MSPTLVARQTTSAITDPSSPNFTGWPIPHWGASAPEGANGQTTISGSAIAGIVVGVAIFLIVLGGVVWLFTRYKRAVRRESMDTLVDREAQAQAEAERRKEVEVGRSPRDTFEQLPEDTDGKRESGSWPTNLIRKTTRQNSADTYVDQSSQPPISLNRLDAPREGVAPDEQVPPYAEMDPVRGATGRA